MKNSLFDYGEKSLTPELIVDYKQQFKDAFSKIKDAQVITSEKDGRTQVQFIPKSSTGVTPRPSVVFTQFESCAGIENMITFELEVSDCATCRGRTNCKFNKSNIGKFDKILNNALGLFKDRLVEAHKVDKEQVEFTKLTTDLKVILGQREVKTGEYTRKTYLGSIEGYLQGDEHEKTFDLKLKNLSSEQIEKIAPHLGAL